MPLANKSRGKAPSVRSRQAALEVLGLVIADIVLNLELDPEEKSKLLSASAVVSREMGLKDSGWYDDPKGVQQ